MPKTVAQIKFTIETDIVSSFRARCADEGVSMTSVIRDFMKTCRPVRGAKMHTRPLRKKAVLEAIGLLNHILELESEYRDHIPEQFAQRIDAADYSCEQLSEAIACLEEAF